MKSRDHRVDAWRGYRIPGSAVAGASDTGLWEDSPCPSHEVEIEIRRLQRECLRPLGVKSRTRYGESSNCFCMKRWVCVSEADWHRVAGQVQQWLDDHDHSLRYLHNADQNVRAA